MTSKISKFLRGYSYETNSINELLVSAFIYTNNIKVKNNIFIKKLLLEENNPDVCLLSELIIDSYKRFSIELLIELFEFVISPAEKEVNGAVYTPQNIREFIVKGCFNNFPIDNWRNLRIADISCGCGGFFISIAEYLKNKISNASSSDGIRSKRASRSQWIMLKCAAILT